MGKGPAGGEVDERLADMQASLNDSISALVERANEALRKDVAAIHASASEAMDVAERGEARRGSDLERLQEAIGALEARMGESCRRLLGELWEEEQARSLRPLVAEVKSLREEDAASQAERKKVNEFMTKNDFNTIWESFAH